MTQDKLEERAEEIWRTKTPCPDCTPQQEKPDRLEPETQQALDAVDANLRQAALSMKGVVVGEPDQPEGAHEWALTQTVTNVWECQKCGASHDGKSVPVTLDCAGPPDRDEPFPKPEGLPTVGPEIFVTGGQFNHDGAGSFLSSSFRSEPDQPEGEGELMSLAEINETWMMARNDRLAGNDLVTLPICDVTDICEAARAAHTWKSAYNRLWATKTELEGEIDRLKAENEELKRQQDQQAREESNFEFIKQGYRPAGVDVGAVWCPPEVDCPAFRSLVDETRRLEAENEELLSRIDFVKGTTEIAVKHRDAAKSQLAEAMEVIHLYADGWSTHHVAREWLAAHHPDEIPGEDHQR